ncbi:MAG: hypothetical protein K0S08_1897 [Gammaproteobacteria bacterium]|jgi:hypothetical protein|nr:hypothetical protein [Gammaproteobacteria bacterium]
MFNSLFKYQSAFAGQPCQFKIYELWREAFKAAKPVWLKLLIANFFLVAVMHFPLWAPILAKMFPLLASLTPSTTWLQSTPFLAAFSHASVSFFPLLYGIFITIPIYLGMNLMSLRAAYQRPVSFSLLTHYLTLIWWMRLISVLFFAFLIFFPIFYGLTFLGGKILAHQVLPQYYLGTLILIVLLLWLATMLSMVLNLVFGARTSVVIAISMSWKNIRLHFWRVLGLLLITYFIWNMGVRSWYLSDLVLVPPNLMAWALLYRRMFGEKGLVE